jgi:hypothetical protein
MDREGDQAKETVVEGAQCRICATCRLLAICSGYVQVLEPHAFASLYLEKPYRCVNSNAQRSTGFFELLNSELGEGYALPGANLFVDTARISIASTIHICKRTRGFPLQVHAHATGRPATFATMVLRVCLGLVIRLLLGQRRVADIPHFWGRTFPRLHY